MGDDAKLSEEEFRRKLYKWLEDQGLLSELRTHLRQQMIAALRGTSLGAHTANSSQAASPKNQALNLLVAEFLLSHEFHYTLSVFTSEVPLLRNLPQFSKVFKSINRGEVPPIDQSKKNGSYPRLQEQEVWDILETLGLPPDCNAGSYVFRRYRQKLNEPLLTSIVCSIPKVIQKWGISELLETKPHGESSQQRDNLEASGDCSVVAEKQPKNCVSEVFCEELQKTLQKLHLKPKNYKRIEDDLKSMLQGELERLQKEERDHFERELLEREERIQKALAEREEEFHQSLIRAEQQLEEQRQTLMMKFQEREAQIIDLAKNMENKCKAQNSKEKCSELNADGAQENVNSDKQREGSGANSSNVEETKTRQQLDEEKELKKIHKAASAQWKLSGTSSHDFAAAKKESQTAQFDFSEYQALLEESFAKQETLTKQLEVYQAQQMLMQDMLHRLQQENCNLRQEIFQQRTEINDLTTRANELTSELQSARPSVSNTAPSGIPAPPPLPPRTGPVPRELASGEEVRYHTSPVATQTLPKNNRDWRRRHRRITLASSSDETSPTEEILRDARLRLRQLEEESEAVDRSYQEFRMRQNLNPYSSVRSVLFQTHRPFQTQNFVNTSVASGMVYDFASCNLQASRNGQGPLYDGYKNMNFNFSTQAPPPTFGHVHKPHCNHHFAPFPHPNINPVLEEVSNLTEAANAVTADRLPRESTRSPFPLARERSPREAQRPSDMPNVPSLDINGVQETCISNTVYSSQVSVPVGGEVRTTNVCNFPLMSHGVTSVTEPNEKAQSSETERNGPVLTNVTNPTTVPVVSSDPKELPPSKESVQSKEETETKSSDPFVPGNHRENVVDAEEVGARLEEKLSRLFQDTLDTGVKVRSNVSSVYLSDVILDTDVMSETKLEENIKKKSLLEENKGNKCSSPMSEVTASSVRNRIQEEAKPAQDMQSPDASKFGPAKAAAADLTNSTEPAELSAESSASPKESVTESSSANVSIEELSAGSEYKKANSDNEICIIVCPPGSNTFVPVAKSVHVIINPTCYIL